MAIPAFLRLPRKFNPASREHRRRDVNRPCVWCGTVYQAKKHDQDFCGTPCRKAYGNFMMVNGARLLAIAFEYTDDRKKLTELTGTAYQIKAKFKEGFEKRRAAGQSGRNV